MALFMVANNLDGEACSKRRELAFPESVVEFFEGRLGRPPYGFPRGPAEAVLGDEKPLDRPPGAYLKPADFAAMREEVRTS